MPELPEVETIVRQLQSRIVGKTITGVTVRKEHMLVGDPHRLVGTIIRGVARRAKLIVITLSSGSIITIHLKMTGQVLVGNSDNGKSVHFLHPIPFAGTSLPGKTTHVIVDLEGGLKLFFNDNRQFGWMKVTSAQEWEAVSQALGPEPLEKEFTPERLQSILASTRRPIKVVLMDPSKIAGIGNIYANEALWQAGIHPAMPSALLVQQHAEKSISLYEAIRAVLELGIAKQGSSSQDEAFVNALGEKGKMQHHFSVYHKVDIPCLRCQTPILGMRLAGRGTFYCPQCQPSIRKRTLHSTQVKHSALLPLDF